MPNEDKRLIGYRDDLRIDLGAIELDWLEHPTTFMKWAEIHAEAVSIRDRKKEELDLKAAELDKEIRSDPDKYGISNKMREAEISAAIKQQDSYRKLSGELINENEVVNILSSAKTAFEHRKKALEGLTQLFTASYFSKPKITQEAKEMLGSQKGREEHLKSLNENADSFGSRKKLTRRPNK